jgi:NAD(P)-dependent dehydrogenase (short-subunit alcohol dehydrogenase family)
MPIDYNPETDIPDLAGKTIFITGGSSSKSTLGKIPAQTHPPLGTAGLGATSALHLAKHNPAHIYISGRNAASAQATIDQIKETSPNTPVTFIECDLASLSSTSKAADHLKTQTQILDILICNAGIMATPPSLTVDGYELQFGTNHLGHALLIKKFLPLLSASPSPRIVMLTSQGWAMHPRGGVVFDDLKTTQNFTFGGPWMRYGQSKLANLVYARELAKRIPGLTALSVHPGIVSTGLIGGLGFKEKMLVQALSWWKTMPVHTGAYNQVWAATVNPGQVVNGGYYEPVGKLENSSLNKTANDAELGERLWNWTEEALKGY